MDFEMGEFQLSDYSYVILGAVAAYLIYKKVK